MATPDNIAQNQRYVNLHSSVIEKCGIVGIILGGSTVYKYMELEDVVRAKDWDGIILVEKKTDIVDLVNNHRSELCQMLDIKGEEYPLVVPSGEADTFAFDAVQLVGRTSENVKKGARILSVDHLTRILQENSPSPINILSFSDVSLLNSQPRAQNIIHQTTHLDNDLIILHDMDIFTAQLYTERCGVTAVFGPTTSLLIAGLWIHQDNFCNGERIVKGLFNKFHSIHTAHLPQPFMSVLYKNELFPPLFKEYLEKRYHEYTADISTEARPAPEWKNEPNPSYYWGNAPDMLVFGKLMQTPKRTHFSEPVSTESEMLEFTEIHSRFSGNSKSGYCFIDGTKVFWKRTTFILKELAGSKVASQSYRGTHQPILLDHNKQIIFYPFFDGDTLAEKRLKCTKQELNSGQISAYEEGLILKYELQRCEDFLRAYCASARMSVANTSSTPEINRFFYDRLFDNHYFKKCYKGGMDVKGMRLTLDDLMNRSLVVNGREYGSISQISENAFKILNPDNFSDQLVVCGLGDGHCANMLVEREEREKSSLQYLYIDYEVAGYHSPILDMAKPFYSDVFFNMFYADLVTSENGLFASGVVAVSLDSDRLIIKLKPPKSSVSNAIYEMKARYLLRPFLTFIGNRADTKLSDRWPSLFGHALFCCAVLARNFSNRPDVFFANLALGAILSGISSLTDDGAFKEVCEILHSTA